MRSPPLCKNQHTYCIIYSTYRQVFFTFLRHSILFIDLSHALLLADRTVLSRKRGVSAVVSGTVSGNWDIAGSPYIVIGDLNLPEHELLTIHPGVQVRFAGGYQLIVNGDLQADGTDSAPIVFTSDQPIPQPGDWASISFSNPGSSSHLQHVRVEYAPDGISIITLGIDVSLAIDHAWIRKNQGDGIDILARSEDVSGYARSIISNSPVEENQGHGIFAKGREAQFASTELALGSDPLPSLGDRVKPRWIRRGKG